MSGPTDADARTQDEGEIRAIVDRMVVSWARGDAVAHHADLTDDADYVAFDGSRRSKADSIASHENLFRTVLYGSRLTGAVESVRFVTPDVAGGASDRLGGGGLAAANAPASAVAPDHGGGAA